MFDYKNWKIKNIVKLRAYNRTWMRCKRHGIKFDKSLIVLTEEEFKKARPVKTNKQPKWYNKEGYCRICGIVKSEANLVECAIKNCPKLSTIRVLRKNKEKV